MRRRWRGPGSVAPALNCMPWERSSPSTGFAGYSPDWRGGESLSVDAAVADLSTVRQRCVNRAVTVAGHVERLADQLAVRSEAGLPADDEAYLDAGEGVRPVVLLLTLHLDVERAERLLELLQKQDCVDARACTQRA